MDAKIGALWLIARSESMYDDSFHAHNCMCVHALYVYHAVVFIMLF